MCRARATWSPSRVTYGAPHHLVADSALDGGPFEVRRTRSGDAWQAARDDTHDHGDEPSEGPVLLGMPARR